MSVFFQCGAFSLLYDRYHTNKTQDISFKNALQFSLISFQHNDLYFLILSYWNKVYYQAEIEILINCCNFFNKYYV